MEGCTSSEKAADVLCACFGLSNTSNSLVWVLHPRLDVCMTAFISACNFLFAQVTEMVQSLGLLLTLCKNVTPV